MVRNLKRTGFNELLVRDRKKLDLSDQRQVERFFGETSPEIVILCAAKVGGIVANRDLPAEFIHQNLCIQNNVISQAHLAGVKSLLFLGSSCIYPRDCPQPIKEEYLLTGPFESTNRPYAVAKLSGIELCWAMNRQYGTRYLSALPCNIYGPGDKYHPKYSHVIPGMIRRIHDAQKSKSNSVSAWGTGTPRREFLFSDDVARACIHLLSLPTESTQIIFNDQLPPIVNIGAEEDVSISELADMISAVVGFSGSIEWDNTKPNGAPQKLLSNALMNMLGWHPTSDLISGLEITYEDFLHRYA